MADDDIYKNKGRYERFLSRVESLTAPPSDRGIAIYWCRNPANVQCFRDLARLLAARDASYARRLRIMQSLRLIVDSTEKPLRLCERSDVDAIMARAHERLRTPRSKETFIADIKHIWKFLFPEVDSHGRVDETIFPYPVRHLSRRIDRSRERMREDKFSWEEFERIVGYFAGEPRMQSYLTFALESLGRPQEILYLRVRDVEHAENYAKVRLREHGKEGFGLLQCIDSYPYLVKWLAAHPLANDPNAFLYVNTADGRVGGQMRPENVNKMIRQACRALGIHKPITCYSLKRNGVTMRRLRGESDLEIQRAARWTSTKQLKTYDLSTQDEAFRIALQKRGLIPAAEPSQFETRECAYCNAKIGFTDTICPRCKHTTRATTVRAELAEREATMQGLRDEVAQLRSSLTAMREEVMDDLMREILARRSSAPRYREARESA